MTKEEIEEKKNAQEADKEAKEAERLADLSFEDRLTEVNQAGYTSSKTEVSGVPDSTETRKVNDQQVELTVVKDGFKYLITVNGDKNTWVPATVKIGKMLGVKFDTRNLANK